MKSSNPWNVWRFPVQGSGCVHCLLVPGLSVGCERSWVYCYCSVRCSLVSPCLEGWLGDGACEGCVPEGKVCATGTPPGTMPSNVPGIPPGATPTTPGGYLGERRPG